ncbi:MAG: hypothetical protein KDD04_11370, partial [Sinomicrobium sp.]|nr:hypothetical protein [Sinomicrobium sp.]
LIDMLRILYSWLILLLVLGKSVAQTPRLEAITIEQGLSQGYVNQILQDREGFIWFATQNGLNRYDGYNFKVYKNIPEDPYSLPDNAIMSFQEAGDFLVVQTESLGISIFDKASQRFFYFPLDLKSLGYFNTVGIKNSLQFLEIQKQGGRLFSFHWPDNLAEMAAQGADWRHSYRIDTMRIDMTLNDMVASADKKGLWLVSDQDLAYVDLASRKISTTALPDKLSGTCKIIYKDPGGVWVQKGSQLAYFNGAQWKISELDLPEYKDIYVLKGDGGAGYVWINTGADVWSFDLSNTDTIAPVLHPEFHLSIPEYAVCYATDSYGNVFLGTDARGV